VGFHFSPDVIEKLRDKHRVTQKEVMECFANGEGLYFEDDREEHRTDPPPGGSWPPRTAIEC
jgi:hypothetical protein